MVQAAHDHPLSIGDLADRTGVPVPTLRSWESRYGFPAPVRMPGGHRRYAESDVAAVREVLHHREAGLALDAAVKRAASAAQSSPSIYAELRRRHPTLSPQTLSKPSLIALSHAIEDECCARAQAPLLFGSFQQARFLRESGARWQGLARTARAAVAFADLGTAADTGPGRLIEVPLPDHAPLTREWAVVCDAPDLPACLVAVERPGHEAADPRRRFDAMWSVDPRVVRDASRVAVSLADTYRPGWRPSDLSFLAEEPSPASPDLMRAADLLNRMVGYLDSAL